MCNIEKLIEKYSIREEETHIAAGALNSPYVSGKNSVYIEVIMDLKSDIYKSEQCDSKLDLCDIVGRSEQLKTKFTVGQKVVVCDELYTTITKIEGDKYWFNDDDGKEWFEV